MYDNSLTILPSKHSHSPHALTCPGKPLDPVVRTSPLQLDVWGMLSRDGMVALMSTDRDSTPLSPQALTITPSGSASTVPSDGNSECFDDDDDDDDDDESPRSFAGEECPDFCGGPKYSCRSWTPPPSPYYYTDENGIFLLDDRQNFEERQKIELKRTVNDLAARLERLRDSVSPPRFLSCLHDELESSTSLSYGGDEKPHKPSQGLPPSPLEHLVEYSHNTLAESRQSYPRDCNGPQRLYNKNCLTPTTASTDYSSPEPPRIMSHPQQEMTAIPSPDLGKLIRTSLQHVQITNSPPRYLTNMSSETKVTAPPPPPSFLLPGGRRNPIVITIPSSCSTEEEQPPVMTKHAAAAPSSSSSLSPRVHLENTAYPTPLPSSPETTNPISRKRGRAREGGLEEEEGGLGRKRWRGKDEDEEEGGYEEKQEEDDEEEGWVKARDCSLGGRHCGLF